jgi:hypothetical protein
LSLGVRVLELDCYDGKKDKSGNHGEPIVYHGGTATKPVSFRDCIEAIGRDAHVSSQYPVIVTMENHCSVEGQVIQVCVCT